MKNIKAVVLLLLCFFLPSLYAYGDNELNIIIKEMSQRAINVLITNTSNEKITYLGVSVEKKESGKWIQLRQDIECPCLSLCAKVSAKILHKNENTTAEWDFLDNSCAKYTSGEYRFTVYGVKNKVILGKSEPFEI